MRKRTFLYICDTVFWYLLYFLPCLVYIVQFIGFNSTPLYSLEEFFSTTLFSVGGTSMIYSSLNSLFGASGILPLFANNIVLQFFSWFVCVFIVHLAVDFLLFIPRLCHKWLDAFTKCD